MKVLAACLTETGAEKLKTETSSTLQTRILDITDSKSVSSAAKWVSAIVGNEGLWGLVNNAGYGVGFGPNEWQTKEEFSKSLNVNLLGTIDVTVNLLHLVRKARGRIVYTSSILALKGLTQATSPRPYEVSDCMEHALTAVHPWTRYSPGLDSKLYFLPVSYFPTAISDYLFCRSAPKPVQSIS
ncbi:hypothetical protein AB205_0135600 [Aquarana catesbeiana]|uniref:Uncharacterized protein n=1 Tax=Aquarana catesbeiana TaxID=8400 RepID=A0A2G9R4L8_AQUCT|nr:hypothetical protein AB205_0135600 [Aquarana catesbeiana]